MEMLGDAEIKYAINGLLSADARRDARARRDHRGAQPVVGRRGVDQGGPRHRPAGRRVDDVRLPAAVRPARSDITRFYPYETHRAPHLRPLRRALQQDLRHRPPARAVGQPARHAPQPVLRPRARRSARCSSTPAAGSGRSGTSRNADLLATVPRPRASRARTSGTPAGGRRSPTPSTCTCATASAWSTSPRSTSSTSRARARSTTCSTCASTTSTSPVGRSVYTPLLTPHGGFRGDLTIMRLGDEHFRVITGAFDGGRDKYWFTRHMPTDGSVTFTDRHAGDRARSACGVPNAEATMAKIVTGQSKPYDVSQAGFPYGAVREVLIDGVPCTMFRISLRRRERLGDLHQHRARPAPVGHRSRRPARSSASVPVGIGVYAVTGRIEKGYRLMGAELESEYNPVEAGLARPKVKSADFIGKEAYLAAREAEPVGDPVHAVDDSTTPAPTARPLPDRRQRADPHARRRAHRRRQGPRRRGSPRPAPRRRSARTCCSPTCRPSTPSRATSCG